jgi:hypothetical protein
MGDGSGFAFWGLLFFSGMNIGQAALSSRSLPQAVFRHHTAGDSFIPVIFRALNIGEWQSAGAGQCGFTLRINTNR